MTSNLLVLELLHCLLLGCPSGKGQSKKGGRLVCAGKRQNGRRIRFPVPPFPCVVANLLICEGKGWVISDKNRRKGIIAPGLY